MLNFFIIVVGVIFFWKLFKHLNYINHAVDKASKKETEKSDSLVENTTEESAYLRFESGMLESAYEIGYQKALYIVMRAAQNNEIEPKYVRRVMAKLNINKAKIESKWSRKERKAEEIRGHDEIIQGETGYPEDYHDHNEQSEDEILSEEQEYFEKKFNDAFISEEELWNYQTENQLIRIFNLAFDKLNGIQLVINNINIQETINSDPHFYRNTKYKYLANSKEDYKSAMALFSSVIELDKKNNNAFIYRAISKCRLNEFNSAIEDCDYAISINANYAHTYNVRGIAYYFLMEYEKAQEDYSEAIVIDPNYSEPYYNRGRVFEDLADYGGAIRDYSRAISINENHEYAYEHRGELKISLEDYEGAIQDLTKAIELNTKNADAYYNRGIVYHVLGELENALEDYTKALEIQPNHEDAYNSKKRFLKKLYNNKP